MVKFSLHTPGGASAEALARNTRERQVGHTLELSVLCFERRHPSMSFIHHHQQNYPGLGLNLKLLSLNTISRIRMLRSTFYPEYAVLSLCPH